MVMGRGRRLPSGFAVAVMLLSVTACDESGDDDGPFIFDPADLPTIADFVVYPGAKRSRPGIPATTPDPAWRPRFEIVRGPTEPSQITSTATVPPGTELEWTFRVPDDSPGDVEALLIRVVDLVEHAEFSKTLTATGTFTHTISLENVGVGTLNLEFFTKATTTAPSRLLVSSPVAVRVTIAAADDESFAVPAGYDSGFASCSGEDSPVTRFAHAVGTGRCFFLKNGLREDCDRCDDVGVDACAERLCAP